MKLSSVIERKLRHMKAGLVTVNKSFSSNRVKITLKGMMLMKRTLYGVY